MMYAIMQNDNIFFIILYLNIIAIKKIHFAKISRYTFYVNLIII